MNLKYVFSSLLLIVAQLATAQNIQTFTLNSASIYITPRPTPVNGQYVPSNYALINKPLVAEPFSDNLQLDVDPISIHTSATGFTSALFGGDIPDQVGFGVVATPIYTTRTYDQSDFPMSISTSFFNAQNTPLYNESYFFIVPADYQSFSSPTFNLGGSDLVKEGIIIGGRPFEGRVFDNQGPQASTVLIAESIHNQARNNEWYTASIVLDVEGNNLIVREYRINEVLVLENIAIGPLNWLDNFRLGIAVDDLASSLRIETQEPDLSVDFALSDSLLCANNCIRIDNLTRYTGDGPIDYNWTFTGADLSSSTDSTINQLCFEEGGTFSVELSATAGGQTISRSKNITILPLLDVDLGMDTLELCNGNSIVLDASDSGADNYFWQDGSTSSTLEITTTDLYIVQATNPCSNVLDSVFVVFSPPLLPPELPTLYSLCEVDSIRLDLTTQNALTYSWSDGFLSPIRLFDAEGRFQLQVANECEEFNFDLLFEKENCCNFYAPNAFSPNFDGQNDAFQIFFNRDACDLIDDFQLQVFDRWGGKVFETMDANFRWDGRKRNELVQPGVYAWRMTYSNNGTLAQAAGEILLVN